MLYSEFLIGTGAADNAWTASEYDRINAIYMDHNEMTKQDAYKMMQAPPAAIAALIEQASDFKARMISAESENRVLRKKIDEIKENVSLIEFETDLSRRHINRAMQTISEI